MNDDQNNADSIRDFVAWWSMIKDESLEFIGEINEGSVKILKDDENVSEYVAQSLQRIHSNMEAMISKAQRDFGI